MSFESHALTLKIWDPATLDHTLDAAVVHVSAKTNTPKDRVKVVRSGPDTFTVGLFEDIA
ncbi:hypothetical protein [Sinomonas sp. ASV322]|uniref:hypothetical protein n=1 Tax=Sinomonas sp. ASV322 TaxID=3041920 RepID=UPI0027DE06CE|nr:hypothetical protein [Sinomonas sp. ASV322]MDQ4501191.1 hypothetical protein [Sinomonas sp. ASV322]